jgi:hypothetical protein
MLLLQQLLKCPGGVLGNDIIFQATDGPGHAQATDDARAICQRQRPWEEGLGTWGSWQIFLPF